MLFQLGDFDAGGALHCSRNIFYSTELRRETLARALFLFRTRHADQSFVTRTKHLTHRTRRQFAARLVDGLQIAPLPENFDKFFRFVFSSPDLAKFLRDNTPTDHRK